jgi:hypothetical protein
MPSAQKSAITIMDIPTAATFQMSEPTSEMPDA